MSMLFSLKIKTQVCDFQLCDVYDKCRDSWLYDSEITAGTHRLAWGITQRERICQES